VKMSTPTRRRSSTPRSAPPRGSRWVEGLLCVSAVAAVAVSAFPPTLSVKFFAFSSPSASKNANFYSIQMNRSLAFPILQPQQNTALHFFYSIQMSSHQSLITDHYSRALVAGPVAMECPRTTELVRDDGTSRKRLICHGFEIFE
jgi:hypothetical protein